MHRPSLAFNPLTSCFYIALCLVVPRAALSQEAISQIDVLSHRIGIAHAIHTSVPPPHFRNAVTVSAEVDAQGNVLSARGMDGPVEYFGQAETIVRARKYKPFLIGGTPSPVTFADFVLILPLEIKASTPVPFPEVQDRNSLRMTLTRTACLGSCPAYSVMISGNGDVEFDGKSHVDAEGHQHAHIPADAVERTLAAYRRADFFSLNAKYAWEATDLPTVTVSISFDDRSKSVVDYAGSQVGMPESVLELEAAIDDAAGTAQWVGDPAKRSRSAR